MKWTKAPHGDYATTLDGGALRLSAHIDGYTAGFRRAGSRRWTYAVHMRVAGRVPCNLTAAKRAAVRWARRGAPSMVLRKPARRNRPSPTR